MQAEDPERQVPAVVERGDRRGDLGLELVRLQRRPGRALTSWAASTRLTSAKAKTAA